MPTLTETVRDIVLKQPSSIRVFEQYGIDYCCGGRKPLAIACTEQDVDIESVLTALVSAAEQSALPAQDWSKRSLKSLGEHIISTHHAYVKKELPRLDTLAKKIIEKHASKHPELSAIYAAQAKLDQELTQHLAKEEMILFPYIAQLERALADGSAKPEGCFGTVANPIEMMTREHEAAGTLLAEIKHLSDSFNAPPDACPSYRAYFGGLKEFEQDLHQHIHLENNILFPRAIAMEASIA